MYQLLLVPTENLNEVNIEEKFENLEPMDYFGTTVFVIDTLYNEDYAEEIASGYRQQGLPVYVSHPWEKEEQKRENERESVEKGDKMAEEKTKEANTNSKLLSYDFDQLAESFLSYADKLEEWNQKILSRKIERKEREKKLAELAKDTAIAKEEVEELTRSKLFNRSSNKKKETDEL